VLGAFYGAASVILTHPDPQNRGGKHRHAHHTREGARLDNPRPFRPPEPAGPSRIAWRGSAVPPSCRRCPRRPAHLTPGRRQGSPFLFRCGRVTLGHRCGRDSEVPLEKREVAADKEQVRSGRPLRGPAEKERTTRKRQGSCTGDEEHRSWSRRGRRLSSFRRVRLGLRAVVRAATNPGGDAGDKTPPEPEQEHGFLSASFGLCP
jgi:hypothetical protein